MFVDNNQNRPLQEIKREACTCIWSCQIISYLSYVTDRILAMITTANVFLLALPLINVLGENSTVTPEIDVADLPLQDDFFPENDRDVGRAIWRSYLTKLIQKHGGVKPEVNVRRFMPDLEVDNQRKQAGTNSIVGVRRFMPDLEENEQKPSGTNSIAGVRQLMSDLAMEIMTSSFPRKLSPYVPYQYVPNWTKAFIKLMPTIMTDLTQIPGLKELVEEEILGPLLVLSSKRK